MASKIALKRLTSSDLTLFRSQYEGVAKQKAINLNASVFITLFYPLLPEAAIRSNGRFPVDLYLYGPGFEGEYNLQRKIVKPSGAKNWRLNGELISNPEGNATRFDILTDGDIALMEFDGSSEVYPSVVRALLVTQAVSVDSALHQVFSARLGTQSMVAIDSTELAAFVASVGLDPAHPVFSFGLEAAVEDAALGGVAGTQVLLGRQGRRRMSRSELEDARARADAIGRLGEEYLDIFLRTQVVSGSIEDYRWESDINAIAPFDFSILSGAQIALRIDAKSTMGPFDRAIHISMSEILEMARGKGEYRIYRLYDVGSLGAKLRISSDMRAFAISLISVFERLPTGVQPDSVSVDPGLLGFSNEPIFISASDGDDQDVGSWSI